MMLYPFALDQEAKMAEEKKGGVLSAITKLLFIVAGVMLLVLMWGIGSDFGIFPRPPWVANHEVQADAGRPKEAEEPQDNHERQVAEEADQNVVSETLKEGEDVQEAVVSQDVTPERTQPRPRRRLPVVTEDHQVRQQASGSCASVDWQQPRTNPGPRPASFTREESRQLARYIVDALFQECEGASRPEYWPIDKQPAPPGELDCLETTPFGSEVCWIVRRRANQQATLEGGE